MERVSTEIKKVSLKDERLNVDTSQGFKLNPESDDVFFDDISRKCSQVVHKDLKSSLDKLKAHIVCICEMGEAVQVDDIFSFDPSELPNYEVTGYTISGSDENHGVVITGKKLLKNGQVLNLVTPFTKFEDQESYKHCGALSSDIEGSNYEVEQYLFHGKWGIKQAEFDFEIPDDANLDQTSEEAA